MKLTRELGIFGATMMGLGSILGTGVFVSIGIATGVAGPAVLLGIGLAAMVATFNGLSSAQLAANHPVSGGTYEYGYEYLSPRAGFMAGWFFLVAKSASAATAALGFGGYFLNTVGARNAPLVPLALAAVATLTIIVWMGIRRSNWTNIIIVSITLTALFYFIFYGGFFGGSQLGAEGLTPFFDSPDHDTGAGEWLTTSRILEATALMFVAYTGYGRIATMGEEVKNPRTIIPRAIIVTLIVSALLYVGVALVGLTTVGPVEFARATAEEAAPLEVIARQFDWSTGAIILAVGAITAMLGVLLNLILGLSRVLLAMGRRGDMPEATARIDEKKNSPSVAVVVMGCVIAALVLIGDVRVAWTFSAFTVLLYYGLTNLAALQLTDEQRYYPRVISWAGLISCFGLAVFGLLAFGLEQWVWMVIAVATVIAGFIWFELAQRMGNDR